MLSRKALVALLTARASIKYGQRLRSGRPPRWICSACDEQLPRLHRWSSDVDGAMRPGFASRAWECKAACRVLRGVWAWWPFGGWSLPILKPVSTLRRQCTPDDFPSGRSVGGLMLLRVVVVVATIIVPTVAASVESEPVRTEVLSAWQPTRWSPHPSIRLSKRSNREFASTEQLRKLRKRTRAGGERTVFKASQYWGPARLKRKTTGVEPYPRTKEITARLGQQRIGFSARSTGRSALKACIGLGSRPGSCLSHMTRGVL